MNNEITETKIVRNLLLGRDLTPRQQKYVQENIEPKYENNCNICRINALLSLGIEPHKAFDAVNLAHVSSSNHQ